MKSIVNIVRKLHREESGQDLIEYALIAALVAFGAVLGMNALAAGINSAFSVIVQKLGTALS